MMPWHAGAIGGQEIVEPYKNNMHFVLHDTINLPQLFNFGIRASNTVQLKGNLMPGRGLPGEHAWLNLQMGAGAGAGARNILHQPLGTRFDQVS